MVHRDLKPANIVLNDEFQIQLTDFGTAKYMIDSNSSVSAVSYISGMSNISNIDASRSHSNLPSKNVSQVNSAESSLDELVGSEFYISPEMLTSRTWSYSSDIWALGVMIFSFFSGRVPFKGKTQDQTFELIKKCEFETHDSEFPKVAQDLVKKLLVVVPENRLGAQNINDLMAHPFFEGIDFTTINDQHPPLECQLELTQAQKNISKYLPKNKSKLRTPKTPQLKKLSDKSLSTKLTDAPFGLNLKKHHSTNLFVTQEFASDSSPQQDTSDISLSSGSDNQPLKRLFSQRLHSEDNTINNFRPIRIEESKSEEVKDQTPKFDSSLRKNTAAFGDLVNILPGSLISHSNVEIDIKQNQFSFNILEDLDNKNDNRMQTEVVITSRR
jgi:serine/threonine protein kinase